MSACVAIANSSPSTSAFRFWDATVLDHQLRSPIRGTTLRMTFSVSGRCPQARFVHSSILTSTQPRSARGRQTSPSLSADPLALKSAASIFTIFGCNVCRKTWPKPPTSMAGAVALLSSSRRIRGHHWCGAAPSCPGEASTRRQRGVLSADFGSRILRWHVPAHRCHGLDQSHHGWAGFDAATRKFDPPAASGGDGAFTATA